MRYLRRLAERYAGKAGVVQVDIDKAPGLAQAYRVEGVPTVVLFVAGREVKRWVGVRDEAEYRAALDAAIAEAAPAGAPVSRKELPMQERRHAVTFKGRPLTLLGPEVRVGRPAPDFTAVANDLSEVSLSSLRGKVVLLASVPSLDTPVCDRETRRFNEEASALGDDVRVVAVSMDLPFAQKRWCGGAGIDRVVTLSDHRDAAFGRAYGVLIQELRLLARAVFVIDAEGVLRHAQVVPEVAQEPDYDAALRAVADLKTP